MVIIEWELEWIYNMKKSIPWLIYKFNTIPVKLQQIFFYNFLI